MAPIDQRRRKATEELDASLRRVGAYFERHADNKLFNRYNAPSEPGDSWQSQAGWKAEKHWIDYKNHPEWGKEFTERDTSDWYWHFAGTIYHHIGLYPLDEKSLVRHAAFDLDDHDKKTADSVFDGDVRDHQLKLEETLVAIGMGDEYLPVTSTHGRGFHDHFFMSEGVPARDFCKLMDGIRRLAGLPEKIERFPKQDRHTGGIGNAIGMPGNIARIAQCGGCAFIEKGDPHFKRLIPPDLWEKTLDNVKELNKARVLELIDIVKAAAEKKGIDAFPEPIVKEHSSTGGSHSDNRWTIPELEKFLTKHRYKYVVRPCSFEDYDHSIDLSECPNADAHTEKPGNWRGSAGIVYCEASGRVGFKCHHNSCRKITWAEARELIEGGERYKLPRKDTGDTSAAGGGESRGELVIINWSCPVCCTRHNYGAACPPLPPKPTPTDMVPAEVKEVLENAADRQVADAAEKICRESPAAARMREPGEDENEPGFGNTLAQQTVKKQRQKRAWDRIDQRTYQVMRRITETNDVLKVDKAITAAMNERHPDMKEIAALIAEKEGAKRAMRRLANCDWIYTGKNCKKHGKRKHIPRNCGRDAVCRYCCEAFVKQATIFANKKWVEPYYTICTQNFKDPGWNGISYYKTSMVSSIRKAMKKTKFAMRWLQGIRTNFAILSAHVFEPLRDDSAIRRMQAAKQDSMFDIPYVVGYGNASFVVERVTAAEAKARFWEIYQEPALDFYGQLAAIKKLHIDDREDPSIAALNNPYLMKFHVPRTRANELGRLAFPFPNAKQIRAQVKEQRLADDPNYKETPIDKCGFEEHGVACDCKVTFSIYAGFTKLCDIDTSQLPENTDKINHIANYVGKKTIEVGDYYARQKGLYQRPDSWFAQFAREAATPPSVDPNNPRILILPAYNPLATV